MIVWESRALKTLSMASAAFCVATRSDGELPAERMPWRNIAAIPMAPTVNTSIAIIVSTSEIPDSE